MSSPQPPEWPHQHPGSPPQAAPPPSNAPGGWAYPPQQGAGGYVPNPYGYAYGLPPNLAYGQYYGAPPARHSGAGIASFVIALLMGVAILGLVITAGVMEASTPGGIDEESPQAIALGLLMLAAILVALVGLVLGIVSMFHFDRRRGFGVFGLVLNLLILCGTAALFVVGALAG